MQEARPGFVRASVQGRHAQRAFDGEAGGHRFQRVPPNEKRGRVHTSTITVAVLDASRPAALRLQPADLREHFCRGRGKGGQHRNKTDTVVVLTHVPSGITVRVDGGRSQDTNRVTARERLLARLQAEADRDSRCAHNAKRAGQVGSGMRGDKVRTTSLVRDEVVDHRTHGRARASDYLKGQLEGLRRSGG